ncbi:MAG: hypothetical protein GC164_00885 [Phycisphaera sp.]|nr:hypothetical protein [Phycisphaera sp.]
MTSLSTTEPSIPCAGCGYDLRGTVLGGTCPECGLRVTATARRAKFYVDDRYVVVEDRTTLPNICVKTGLTAEEQRGKQVTKKLYWAHPALFLLILLTGSSC